MKKNEELELLISEKELTVNDKQVVVKKISMLNTIRIASNISDIVAKALSDTTAISSAIAKMMYKEEKDGEEYGFGIQATGVIELLGIIGDDGVSVIKDIIIKSTNLTGVEVEELDIVDGVDILLAIYEVNKGFFMKCGKKLQEKMEKVQTKTKKK